MSKKPNPAAMSDTGADLVQPRQSRQPHIPAMGPFVGLIDPVTTGPEEADAITERLGGDRRSSSDGTSVA